MNTAELLVQCLENEGVEYVFGLPGEENLQVLAALKIFFNSICHDTTRAGSRIYGGCLRSLDG